MSSHPEATKKLLVSDLHKMKADGKKISMITAYTYLQGLIVDEAGAFALILEAIPQQLAQIITEKVKIPTIGIGGGVYCDGQVLVLHDLLGLFKRFTPKFVKVYTDAYTSQLNAVKEYISDVQDQSFPAAEHSFNMKKEMVEELKKAIES